MVWTLIKEFAMIQKKAYARVLSCVAQSGKDGGIKVQQITVLMLSQFGKECTTQAVMAVLSNLKSQGYVDGKNESSVWTPTKKGMDEYRSIKLTRERLLGRTTSPSVPMIA